MEQYLWMMLVYFFVDAMARLFNLSLPELLPQKRSYYVVDTLFTVVFLAATAAVLVEYKGN